MPNFCPNVKKKMKQVETNDKIKDSELAKAWYRTALVTAVVAGVFSLIICVLLVSNYFQSKISDPLDSGELDGLRAKLLREPKNDSIKEQIRALDLKLRNEYFRHRKFSDKGGYLLLISIVVFLIGIKSAAAYRKKLPMPQPETDEQGQETRSAMMTRWSVAAFALVVVGVALSLMVISGSGLTRESLKSADVSVASYPSPEEIKKNWPRFRGPGGLGISAVGPPHEYSNQEKRRA